MTEVNLSNHSEFLSEENNAQSTDTRQLHGKLLENTEKLWIQQAELEEKIAFLSSRLEKYSAMDESLKNTLCYAKETAEDALKTVTEPTGDFENKAAIQAKHLLSDARNEFLELREQTMRLLKAHLQYKEQVLDLLDSLNNLMYKERAALSSDIKNSAKMAGQIIDVKKEKKK